MLFEKIMIILWNFMKCAFAGFATGVIASMAIVFLMAGPSGVGGFTYFTCAPMFIGACVMCGKMVCKSITNFVNICTAIRCSDY